MSQRRIKHMFKQLRDASLKYKLIEDGDRILAGISGGKDSLTMLYLLTLVQKYTPVSFTLYPVMLDMGWGEDHQAIADYCESLGLKLRVEYTHIGRIVFEHRREKNPCSLCSNLRHGALNRIAKSLGCNKVALGHHMDDAVHTFFLSMLFEGASTFSNPGPTWIAAILPLYAPWSIFRKRILPNAQPRLNCR